MTQAFRVDPNHLRFLHNGIWQSMPHRHFYDNNEREHLYKNKVFMKGKEVADAWKAQYQKQLLEGQVVTVNHVQFKIITDSKARQERERHVPQTQTASCQSNACVRCV